MSAREKSSTPALPVEGTPVGPPSIELQAKLFRGLADPSRLSILHALRAGPLSVGAIVAATGLSQPNASNHLRCLSDCGLVAGEQRGRFVRYRLGDPLAAEMLALAAALLAGAGSAEEECENYTGRARGSRTAP